MSGMFEERETGSDTFGASKVLHLRRDCTTDYTLKPCEAPVQCTLSWVLQHFGYFSVETSYTWRDMRGGRGRGLVDRPIMFQIFICQQTNTKDIAGQSVRGEVFF